MNEKQARQAEAHRRMVCIEEHYSHHVPVEVQHLYRLEHLIYLANFQRYYDQYGLLPISPGDVVDAREELGLGPTPAFDREVIDLLNEDIDAREARDSRSQLVPLFG